MHSYNQDVQLWCCRLYLEKAKEALAEAGGTYTPSIAEQKAAEFDNNIPFICKVVFTIGGFFSGRETRTYTISGDRVHTNIERLLIPPASNLDEFEEEEPDK